MIIQHIEVLIVYHDTSALFSTTKTQRSNTVLFVFVKVNISYKPMKVLNTLAFDSARLIICRSQVQQALLDSMYVQVLFQ